MYVNRYPYSVLEDLIEPHQHKLRQEGFKANLPLIQDIIKSWWNKVREIPTPIVVSNLGKQIDFWVPNNAGKTMLEALNLVGTLRLLRMHGMTEFFVVGENWQWNQKDHEADWDKVWRERPKDKAKDTVSLHYHSPDAQVLQYAEVKAGKNVRYLALPFESFDDPGYSVLPHPRWRVWLPDDQLVEDFVSCYEPEDADGLRKFIKTALTEIEQRGKTLAA